MKTAQLHTVKMSKLLAYLIGKNLGFSSLVLLLLAAHKAEPSHRWRSNNDLRQMYDSATASPTGSLSGPWIEVPWSNNVTGVARKTSYLTCRVNNLGNQTVSWLRHVDTHLLTTGLYTYTQDPRFSAIHRSNSEDWVLEIRETIPSDKGLYECQVSTTPIRKHIIHLSVAEPVTTIHGGVERHIKFGSKINLTCEVQKYPGKLNYIIWYKNNESLMKKVRHNITLVRSKPGLTISRLIVNSADQSDTGSYTCSSEAGDSNQTAIHVIIGETRAGLQVNSAGGLRLRCGMSKLHMIASSLAIVALLLASNNGGVVQNYFDNYNFSFTFPTKKQQRPDEDDRNKSDDVAICRRQFATAASSSVGWRIAAGKSRPTKITSDNETFSDGHGNFDCPLPSKLQ